MPRLTGSSLFAVLPHIKQPYVFTTTIYCRTVSSVVGALASSDVAAFVASTAVS